MYVRFLSVSESQVPVGLLTLVILHSKPAVRAGKQQTFSPHPSRQTRGPRVSGLEVAQPWFMRPGFSISMKSKGQL